jgi:hypothetical protein
MRPPKCSTIWRLIGKPSPVPCGRFVGIAALAELLEDQRALRRRHAGAVVLHLDGGALRRRCAAQLDAAARAGTNLAALDSRFSSTCISRSGSARSVAHCVGQLSSSTAPRSRSSSCTVCAACAQRHQVDVGVVPFGVAGLDLRHVQHLVDEPAQALGLGHHDGQELLALLGGHLGVVDHQLGQRADRRSAACAARASPRT